MSFAPRIRVDFNRRSADYVIASARRASAEIAVGEVVVAYQPGEEMEHFARVVEVQPDSSRVVLEVDWTSVPSEWAPAVAGWSTAAFDALVPSGSYRSFYRTSAVTTAPPRGSGQRNFLPAMAGQAA